MSSEGLRVSSPTGPPRCYGKVGRLPGLLGTLWGQKSFPDTSSFALVDLGPPATCRKRSCLARRWDVGFGGERAYRPIGLSCRITVSDSIFTAGHQNLHCLACDFRSTSIAALVSLLTAGPLRRIPPLGATALPRASEPLPKIVPMDIDQHGRVRRTQDVGRGTHTWC